MFEVVIHLIPLQKKKEKKRKKLTPVNFDFHHFCSARRGEYPPGVSIQYPSAPPPPPPTHCGVTRDWVTPLSSHKVLFSMNNDNLRSANFSKVLNKVDCAIIAI